MSHLPRVVRRHTRRLLDGGTDTGIRGASTEIAAHRVIDVAIARFGISREQRGRRHHLAGLAVAALHDIEREPRLLHPLTDLRVAYTLDGHHRSLADSRHGRDARSGWHTVQMHRASAAEGHAATEFRALEIELIAKHPEK